MSQYSSLFDSIQIIYLSIHWTIGAKSLEQEVKDANYAVKQEIHTENKL